MPKRKLPKFTDRVKRIADELSELQANVGTGGGSGSGFDADLLDGLDSTAFLKLVGGTMAGNIDVDADNSRDLGSSSKGFDNIYASDVQGRNVGDIALVTNQARGGFPNASPPSTANADDAEFNNTTAAHNNTIGTWAGGDFWEAIAASANASIHSTENNFFWVRARRTDVADGEYKADVAALAVGTKITIGVQWLGMYSATSDDRVELRMWDSVNSLEANIRIENNAGQARINFLTGTIGALASRATLNLYPPYGGVALQLHWYDTTHVRAFINVASSHLSKSSFYTVFGAAAGYVPGAGWAPNIVSILFGQNDDGSPAYSNDYALDFFRRS